MQISGILPALVTPLDENGKFLPESLALLLQRCYQAGVDGVYVGGNTGEGMLQSVAMRAEVIGATVQSTPAGKLVVAHVGCASTADAVALAQRAAKAGAHAVSSLPPSEAGSFAEVKQYFVDLAAATDLPLLVYHFPERAPLASTHQALTDLLEIESVVGIKFTDYNLYTLTRLKKLGTRVLNGRDEVLAAGLLMGADGGIGSFYNLVPDLFVKLYNQTRTGDWAGVRRTQDRINELIEITLRFPMLAAIKLMLTWSGIPCGLPIPPHEPLTAEQETALRAALTGAGFAPDGFCN